MVERDGLNEDQAAINRRCGPTSNVIDRLTGESLFELGHAYRDRIPNRKFCEIEPGKDVQFLGTLKFCATLSANFTVAFFGRRSSNLLRHAGFRPSRGATQSTAPCSGNGFASPDGQGPSPASPPAPGSRPGTAARWRFAPFAKSSANGRSLRTAVVHPTPVICRWAFVVLDNLGSHKGKAVQTRSEPPALASSPSPNSSPDLIPSEQIFARLCQSNGRSSVYGAARPGPSGH